MNLLFKLLLVFFIIGLCSVMFSFFNNSNRKTSSSPYTNGKSAIFQNERTNQLAEKIKRGDIEAVRSMLTAGADVKEVGAQGLTLPHIALLAETNGPQIMTLLLDAGADPISMLDDGRSVPQYAASRDNADPEMMRVLLQHGISANWFPPSGSYKDQSLLQSAITGDNLPIVQLLVQFGADLDYVEPVAGSALHFALSNANFPIAAFLVDAGIDLSLRNHMAAVVQNPKAPSQTALERFCAKQGGRRGHNPLPEVAEGWRTFTEALAKRGVTMPCGL